MGLIERDRRIDDSRCPLHWVTRWTVYGQLIHAKKMKVHCTDRSLDFLEDRTRISSQSRKATPQRSFLSRRIIQGKFNCQFEGRICGKVRVENLIAARCTFLPVSMCPTFASETQIVYLVFLKRAEKIDGSGADHGRV